jgi:phosphoglycerate dehydrogenase-like enzyme
MSNAFQVGVTRDVRRPDGSFVFAPVDLEPLDRASGIEWRFLEEDVLVLTPRLLDGFDALFHFSPAVTAASIEGVERLAILARHGVGLDMIDLDACTKRGIAVTITPEGVRGPIGSGAVALILALAHRLVERHLKLRQGDWQGGRFGLMGVGLTGRTLGIIGFGRIGREVARVIEPYGMRILVTTPRLAPDDPFGRRVERVELEALLAESDFVVVACPLKPETHHLLDRRRLALMRPTAYLVNVARGPIVDEAALVEALREGRLAGAGLDVFEREPLDPGSPLLRLDNIVVAPHALGYTDELFRGCVRGACDAILAVAAGREPAHVVNQEVLDHSAFRRKLATFSARWTP